MRYFLNKIEKTTKCLVGLEFLGKWKALFMLACLLGGLICSSLYYFQPQIEEVNEKRSSYKLKKLQDRGQIKPERVVECLAAFAKIDNPDIWIHTIKYKDEQIDLVTHSSDIKSVDEYIDAVSNLANMFILNKEIKEKDAKSLLEKVKSAPKRMSSTLARLLKRRETKTKNIKNKEGASDEIKENIPDFTYEAIIKLKI